MDLLRYQGSDWVGMVFAFISLYYLGKGRKLGFLLAIFGNISWVIFGMMTESVANILANCIYIVLNVVGWRRWKDKQAGHPTES